MILNVRSLPPYKILDLSESARKYEDVMDIKNRMEEMINAGDRFIAVNLVQVEYMHSFFIKILTITYKKLRASGGDLVLIAPNSFIKELIQLLNLQEFITLFNSELSLADYLKSG